MVLSVLRDESSDETRQRGDVFHAADCEYARRRDEYAALVQVLAASPVGGVVHASRRESNANADRAYNSFINEPGWESALLRISIALWVR
jgi:hypothetical protein